MEKIDLNKSQNGSFYQIAKDLNCEVFKLSPIERRFARNGNHVDITSVKASKMTNNQFEKFINENI